MKYLFLTALLFSLRVSAQYDTALITRSINFLTTDQFKSEFPAFAKEMVKKEVQSWPVKKNVSRYKSQQERRINFWLQHHCFASDTNYFTPILSTGGIGIEGVMQFRQYDTLRWKPVVNCIQPEIVEAFFIAPDVVEIRNFQGTKTKGIWFGESNMIRLQWNADKPKIIWWGYMIHN